MKKKDVFKCAYNSYLSFCDLVKGMDFEECYKWLKDKNYDVMNKDSELFDCNVDYACLTIVNINGKASVSTCLDVWDDTKFLCCYDAVDINDVAKIGGIRK